MSIKSFDEIRGLVENVVRTKTAREANTPKDPFEVNTPSASDKGMITECCMDVPCGKENGTATEKDTASLPVKDSEQPSSVKPEKEPSEKVTESAVTKSGSALLEKIQKRIAEAAEVKEASEEEKVQKEAAVENVAKDINLSTESLAKIAKEILNTEEGVKYAQDLFRKKAGEEYAAAAIKEATEAAEVYAQYEELLKKASEEQESEEATFINKVASEIGKLPEEEQQKIAKSIAAHDANLSEYSDAEILKRAYAAGVADAEGMSDVNPADIAAIAEPSEEEMGEAQITPEEIIEAVSEMVEDGQLDEQTAQQLIAEILETSEEVEDAPEVAAEEVAPVVEEAATAGNELTPEEQAALANEVAAAETAKVAHAIIEGTQRLKTAAVAKGTLDKSKEQTSLEDVIAVIEALQAEGSITEQEAQDILQVIAEALSEKYDDLKAADDEVAEEKEEPKDDEVEVSEEVEVKEPSDDEEEMIEKEAEKVASVLA